MKKILNDPNGWIVYFNKVEELLGRKLSKPKGEIGAALSAYIKPIPAEQFAEKLAK